MAVGGQLDAVERAGAGRSEMNVQGVVAGALAHQPSRDELRVGVRSRSTSTRRHSRTRPRSCLGDVLLLRVAERPDFVALDACGREGPRSVAVLVCQSRPCPRSDQELRDGVDRSAR